MNDDSKINNTPVIPEKSSVKNGVSAGSDSDASIPAPGFSTNDVPPPDFGDRPLESSRARVRHQRADAVSDANDFLNPDKEPDEDAGEGHKGPRVDVTRVPTDHDSQ